MPETLKDTANSQHLLVAFCQLFCKIVRYIA